MSIIPTIRDRAVLAYVTISCWSARKLDRKASRSVTKDAGASDDAARVNKYLLSSADQKLKDIQSIAGKTRRYLEDNSLPWDDAGNRLLSNAKALEVVSELSAMEKEFNDAVDDFVSAYPVLRAEAMTSLGDLADHDDYPQPDQVRHKFAMRLSLTPVPENFDDLRTGMTPTEVSALQQHFESSVRAQTNRALMSAWMRLRDDVASMAERLAKDEDGKAKIFRNSLVDNVRSTCALLASLNVFGDHDLDNIRADVEANLCGHDAQALRDNDALSRSVQGDAAAVLARINAILGD
jgi:hypothetical protein